MTQLISIGSEFGLDFANPNSHFFIFPTAPLKKNYFLKEDTIYVDLHYPGTIHHDLCWIRENATEDGGLEMNICPSYFQNMEIKCVWQNIDWLFGHPSKAQF